MSDRYFNRDRSRAYQSGFNEYDDRDFEPRGRPAYGDEFDYDYDLDHGRFDRYGSARRRSSGGYGRYTGAARGGYDPRRDHMRAYDFDFGADFGSTLSREYNYGGRGLNLQQAPMRDWRYGYRGNIDARADYDRWNRGSTGSGYGPYGRSAGRYERAGTGRYDYGGYGAARSGGYDYDFNMPSTRQPYLERWFIPGPFTGVGPEGYQRSDERILEDANERLARHGQLDARRIEVQVKNGEVTLSGMVDSRQAKRMAEDTIETIAGVKDINNELRVENPLPESKMQKEAPPAGGQQAKTRRASTRRSA